MSQIDSDHLRHECLERVPRIKDRPEEAYNQLRLNAMVNGRSHFLEWFETYNDEWVEFFDEMACDGPTGLVDIIVNLHDLLKTSMEFAESVGFIDQWIETGSGRLDDYLNWLATYNISDEVEPENKGLQIMTIHAAKGLEFPSVIIAGCNEGILPSPHAIKAGNFEDERRLMYVAITRARDNLMLTIRPEAKEYHGKVMVNPESRFVNEALRD
ncbi:3'-5' exonuclease [uncultured Desulfosarcina sp.]|uniref:3'-5' exonuclease n=1 Tax=uncultured Desulfosarcina sp. TaxID=218289 RepID=UPI0029C8B153|nr:3'-5' exonuclease [uncultured Desulfosarcina sp.]